MLCPGWPAPGSGLAWQQQPRRRSGWCGRAALVAVGFVLSSTCIYLLVGGFHVAENSGAKAILLSEPHGTRMPTRFDYHCDDGGRREIRTSSLPAWSRRWQRR